MGKTKPPVVTAASPHPFERAFPTTYNTVRFIGACGRLVAGLVRGMWPFRRELLAVAVIAMTWYVVGLVLPPGWALLVGLLILAGPLAAPGVWRRVWAWLHCGRVRRMLRAGFDQTRSANGDGHVPRVLRITPTAVGERVQLRLKPGHAYELLEVRTELFRAAVRARDVRVTRDVNRSHRVTLDVIRRDTLSKSAPIDWEHLGADVLSAWDPLHLGVSELGRPIYLSLVERALIAAGNRGAGKSNLLNVLLAHLSKCPDAHLLLIDANRIQFAPYRDRALAFADHDPDTALAVIQQVRDELDRRLDWLMGLPGAPVALTRDLSAAHGVPMWVLMIDELAYHTSVAGTKTQQAAFYAGLRDVVARGRAAGIVVIVATQRPTADLIPTSLRDLFDIRIAYRTMTSTSSDVILGDGLAKRGFSATDIDITARGVCWLLAEDTDPVRMKTCFITPETRVELAVTTVRHKPAPPPTAAPVAVPAARLEATP